MMSKKKLSSWIIILENCYCVIINEYFLKTLEAASFFIYVAVGTYGVFYAKTEM